MWRNLKSPSLCVQIMLFYAVLLQKVCFFAIYAVFRKIGLLQFTRYCVEKILAKNSDRGEKMTNIKYVLIAQCLLHSAYRTVLIAQCL